MLTVNQLSQQLSLSLAKCYALIQSGEIKCHRFGRSVRVSEQQLEEFLENTKSEVVNFEPSSSKHF